MQEDIGKLVKTARKSHDVLFEADTIFPFMLFPDTIRIDREMITITHRAFWRVAKTTSVQIPDILSVELSLGPFFGSLSIKSRYFINNPQRIQYLWRSQAQQAHDLLQGYIIAAQKDIDCTDIPKPALLTLLQDLGQGVSY